MEEDLLELIVGASRLMGQVEYNLEMDSGRKHKRGMLFEEYKRSYRDALIPYRDSLKEVNRIMSFFDEYIKND